MSVFLSSIFLFVGFGFFHSICAQDFFKKFLRIWLGGEWFEKYCWRLVYSILSWVFFFKFIHVLQSTPEATLRPFFLLSPWMEVVRQFLRLVGLIMLYLTWLQMNVFSFLGFKQFITGLMMLAKMNVPDYLLQNNIYGENRLEVGGLFQFVRHPMYAASILMLVSDVPNYRNLIFLFLMLGYTFIGAHFEEKKLLKRFGTLYIEYQYKTGFLLPKISQILRGRK